MALIVPHDHGDLHSANQDLLATSQSMSRSSSLSKAAEQAGTVGALNKLSKDQLTGILKHAQKQVITLEAENRLLKDELYRIRAHMEKERLDFLFRDNHFCARAQALCARVCVCVCVSRARVHVCAPLVECRCVLPAVRALNRVLAGSLSCGWRKRMKKTTRNTRIRFQSCSNYWIRAR